MQVGKTLQDILGVEIPMLSAPSGGASGPDLVSAVSNAGSYKFLPLWGDPVDAVRESLQEYFEPQPPFVIWRAGFGQKGRDFVGDPFCLLWKYIRPAEDKYRQARVAEHWRMVSLREPIAFRHRANQATASPEVMVERQPFDVELLPMRAIYAKTARAAFVRFRSESYTQLCLRHAIVRRQSGLLCHRSNLRTP